MYCMPVYVCAHILPLLYVLVWYQFINYSRTSMARTLIAPSPWVARTIIMVPTGHFMHTPLWMTGTTLSYNYFFIDPTVACSSHWSSTRWTRGWAFIYTLSVFTYAIHVSVTIWCAVMRGSRKFCQRGSNFDNVFLSWWGERGSKYHHKQTIIGPPAKRHLNGVSLACPWWPNIECWLGSLVIFQGIRTSIARKPYFVIIQSGFRPLPPSESVHDCHKSNNLRWLFDGWFDLDGRCPIMSY